jgi:tripartite-type tricarboxylate transporter receptor subunit TctC
MKLSRRAVIAGLTTSPFLAQAQSTYPQGINLKVIVPFPAGGTTDIVGRLISERLAQRWGITSFVENVSGAASNLGMDRVAKGVSDGSQILIISPNISTNQYLFSKLPLDVEKDIIGLSQVVSFPNLLCVRKNLPVNSVSELIGYAKANPGKLNYASSGIGTTIHLSAELFKYMTKIEMTHVPYRGSALAITDLLGGQVDLMFDNIPSILPHAKAGNVKALGVTSLKRNAFAPEYAPISDTVPGYEAFSWFGVGVRAGTPKDIQDKIEKEVIAICQEAGVKAKFSDLVADTHGSSAFDFQNHIRIERAKWGKLITDLKIKAE